MIQRSPWPALVVVIVTILATLGASCTKAQERQVRAVLGAGEAGCVLLSSLSVMPDGGAEDVCLAVPELRQAIEGYLRAKGARAAASASASAAPKGSP